MINRTVPAPRHPAPADASERARRQAAESALRESEERFRAIVETTEDWIWETDADGRVCYSNPGAARILGIPTSMLIGSDPLDFVLHDDREAAHLRRATEHRHDGGWRNHVLRWRHRDGSVRFLEGNAQPRWDRDGGFAGFRGIDRDVTQRVLLDQKVRQLARIHAVRGAVGNAILHAKDRQSLLSQVCRLSVEEGEFAAALVVEPALGTARTVSCSHGDARRLRASKRALSHPTAGLGIGTPAGQVKVEDMASPVAASTREAATEDFGADVRITVPLGSEPWGLLVLHSRRRQAVDADELALLDRVGAEIDHALDFITKSERLEHLAYHHPVTGLYNRTAFRDLLAARMERAPLIVALVDVAHFHYFNDSRGREFCEVLLREIGRRLQERCGDESLVAHIGDELFALVLPGTGSFADSAHTLEVMLELSSHAPLRVQGEEVFADFRCGVLHAPRHGQDAEAVERNALSALSEARNRSLRLVAYSEGLSNRAQKRLKLESELRQALDLDQFELFLQPKFNTRSTSLTGAEALLRWRHPERGLVSPADFIPILEDTGLIVPVGRWIMRRALETTARWRSLGYDGLRLAINVSARELREEGFVSGCAALLREFDGNHGLDIELTESLLMEDIDRSILILQALRDLGCSISIDDFGTGYSSLSYLSRLPADVLKIDRSFISEIALSPQSLSLVTNTIGLAHSLEMSVIAEGVEEREQANLLRLLRCDELQGYLFGQPQPIAAFEAQYIA